MRWWNDLWLNEGFATYMQYLSLDRQLPQLDAVSTTVSQIRTHTHSHTPVPDMGGVGCQGNVFLRVRLEAMAKDSLNSSHPVSTQVTSPEQVEEMFDSVSYEKVLHAHTSTHTHTCVRTCSISLCVCVCVCAGRLHPADAERQHA